MKINYTPFLLKAPLLVGATILIPLLFYFLPLSATAQVQNLTSTPSPMPTLEPGIKSQIPKNAIRVDIREADLFGNGKKGQIISYTVEQPGGSQTGTLLVVSSGLEKPSTVIWKYKEPDFYSFDAQLVALDPNNPKQIFLVVNCTCGGVCVNLRVFKWDGIKFTKVETGDINQPSFPGTMNDGRKVILVDVGTYGDEGPDIYKLEKGVLVPCNYEYPGVYQEDIDKTLDEFNKRNTESGFRLQTGTRGIMRFLYGGRIKEGIELYKKMEKLKDDVSNYEFPEHYLFRSFAYLELGQKNEAIEELKKFPHYQATEHWYASYFGDYYYMKEDFKTALHYYLLAETETNLGRKGNARFKTWDNRIRLLRDVLGAK